MSIETFIEPKSNLKDLIISLLIDKFKVQTMNIESAYDIYMKPYFDTIKDNCSIIVEYPYVDKVYRDSYYIYYSSKLTYHDKDCIRLSFFEGTVVDADFKNNDQIKVLQERFWGFISIRPIEPYFVGRGIVSPHALKHNNFKCCTAKFNTTVNYIKFEIEGFPHASQDTETMTCAETALWAIMEYFGNKYPEYRPVLPSRIINVLTEVTYERQMPSTGLYLNQISFALKEFGFGPRIYSREVYKEEFNRLMSCYVESGIPLIVAIENTSSGGDIRHALLCIGHENVSTSQIRDLDWYTPNEKDLNDECKKSGIALFDFDDIDKRFIFIDDNCPAYQSASLPLPAIHYPKDVWHNCSISYFIAPLYRRIYLEAYQAKSFIIRLLLLGPRPLKKNTEVLLRIYLSSSRTFKDNLAKHETFEEDFKYMVLETPMPRFIWIAELSNKQLGKRNMANGIVILDATEANTYSLKPLIFAAYDGNLFIIDSISKKLKNIDVTLQDFCKFENNLKTY